ncbi:hypothetical protein KUV62_20450 [Salipiger bermudensis]|uniref:hypothetical protein n=1 Tax=Salipiger bermudensis TaxID=344736 RepID=UPI001C998589|nr:hypothetical protein [Salipiger bermudensis]MBY6006305.1 hypothetical protein [Salipiger bermudensis]
MPVFNHVMRIGAALALATAPAAALADPVPCDDPGVLVEAPDEAARTLICEAAGQAREALAVCGLVPVKPIVIATEEGVIHGMGLCLAAYDCTQNRIRIIAPDLMRAHLLPEDPYSLLPDEVVFGSLLTHEMAHAVVEQTRGVRPVALVDHEFIANAMELSAMPEQHRQTLLDLSGITPPVTAGYIDLLIYGLAPRRFSAAAYYFLEAQGCDVVTGILEGRVSFVGER